MSFSQELNSIFSCSDLDKEDMQPKTVSSQDQQEEFPFFLNQVEDKCQQLMQFEYQPVNIRQSDFFNTQNDYQNPFIKEIDEEIPQRDKNLEQEQKIPQKIEISNSQQQLEYLFISKNIFTGTVKNTNFPKFLLKNLQSYFEQHAKQILEKPNGITNVARKIRRLKYRNKSKNLSALKSILTRPAAKNATSLMTRVIMNDILLKNRRTEIIENNHVQNKKSYLNAAKVYALRCRSEGLIDRLTSR